MHSVHLPVSAWNRIVAPCTVEEDDIRYKLICLLTNAASSQGSMFTAATESSCTCTDRPESARERETDRQRQRQRQRNRENKKERKTERKTERKKERKRDI